MLNAINIRGYHILASLISKSNTGNSFGSSIFAKEYTNPESTGEHKMVRI